MNRITCPGCQSWAIDFNNMQVEIKRIEFYCKRCDKHYVIKEN